jgi:predicted transposase YbfD/YdcC
MTAKKAATSKPETTSKNPTDPAHLQDKTEPDLTRYFISSLNPGKADPGLMAHQIRSHWCCESRHWQRDALWREDTCRLQNPNAACALGLLRASLQTLLRLVGRTSLPGAFEDVAHDLSLGLGWLKSRKFAG